MRIWKRLLGLALCLCLCAELLPVTARAAATLPVIEISTSGKTYQYAESGTNRTQLAYGTKKAETPISTVTTETGNGGTRFTLDTGWDRNFKLIYKEIPVKVTVPANTEYTVTFSYIFNGSYHQHTGQTTAKFAAQAIYLDKNRASTDVTFYTAAGSGVKTTRGTSEVANVHSVTVTNGNKPVEKPGSSNGSVFTAKFRNDTAFVIGVSSFWETAVQRMTPIRKMPHSTSMTFCVGARDFRKLIRFPSSIGDQRHRNSRLYRLPRQGNPGRMPAARICCTSQTSCSPGTAPSGIPLSFFGVNGRSP